jgi:polysaccharide biosynthesis protein PslH
MKILFVAPRFPYPLTQGDRLLCYHRLRTLSQSHEITLITFYQSPQEIDNLPKLSQFCQNIHTVYLPRWKSLRNCVRNLFVSQLPLQIAYYQLDRFQDELDRIISTDKFDVIHFLMLRVAEYRLNSNIPQIIEIVDSMQLNLQTRIPFESPIKRYLYQEELKRITKYENQLDRRFNKIIVCAEKDAEFLVLDRKYLAIVSTGTDIELFRASSNRNIDRSTLNIIFTGKMSYAPNIHAARWFVNNCWQLLKQELPDVRLTIAGADPPPEIIKFDRIPGIHVTGFVPSIVDILNQSDIAITPMQSGSGMQSKIFEAMSCSLPVITTSLGLGSIEAKVGEEILVADSPVDFVNAIVQLSQNKEQMQQIGTKARIFVEKNHSWETGSAKVEAIYREVIAATMFDNSNI